MTIFTELGKQLDDMFNVIDKTYIAQIMLNVGSLLVDTAKDILEKQNNRILFFDTETTGIPRGNGGIAHYKDDIYKTKGELLEIAYILCDEDGRNEITGEYLIKKPLSYRFDNERWHETSSGITAQVLHDEGVEASKVLDNIEKQLMSCNKIVSYNIEFDINILKSFCFRNSRSDLVELIDEKEHFCLMKYLSGGKRYKKLSDLYKMRFGEIPSGIHRAMTDTKMCKDLYF